MQRLKIVFEPTLKITHEILDTDGYFSPRVMSHIAETEEDFRYESELVRKLLRKDINDLRHWYIEQANGV